MFKRPLNRARSFFRLLSYHTLWCVPPWGFKEFSATLTAVLTGRLVRGRHAKLFADEIGSVLGKRFAVPFNRGRFAIEFVLRGLNVGKGDDVVVPSYVCSTVLDGIHASGARPCFADVGDDLNLDLESVLRALTPETRCVIVPHLFGKAAPVALIAAEMEQRGIHVIDDAAQSFGATDDGRWVGSFGVAGVVGCGAGKSLSGAAGAVLVTDDLSIYQFASSLSIGYESWFQVAKRLASHWVFRRFRRLTLPLVYLLDSLNWLPAIPEHAAYMANVDAAIGRVQLAKLSATSLTRRCNASRVATTFRDAGVPAVNNFDSSCVALKLILILPAHASPMDLAIKLFGDFGIECEAGYAPCHLKGVGRESTRGIPLPTTEFLWQRVLCIPVEREIPSGLLASIVSKLIAIPAASANEHSTSN